MLLIISLLKYKQFYKSNFMTSFPEKKCFFQLHHYCTDSHKVEAVVQSSAVKPFFEFLVSCRLSLKNASQEAILRVHNDQSIMIVQ